MSDSRFDPAELIQIEERLRQERETFDQRKAQESRWFSLRLRMGYAAAIMLPCIAALSGYILLNDKAFSRTAAASAGAALFADILGLLIAIWKVVLNPASVARLDPVTDRLSAATQQRRPLTKTPAKVSPSTSKDDERRTVEDAS